jgi:hypothetical protein
LEDLEELNIIKVLERKVQPAQKLFEKYAGKLPADIAEELRNYFAKSRNEWNRKGI